MRNTQAKLVETARRLFSERGIENVSLREISRAAEQGNVSALQYHFGDRMGLIEALTARRVHQMAVHRDELVDALPAHPTVRQLVEVIVSPLAAMLGDPGGSAYLRIQAELLAHPNRDELPELLAHPWSRPGLERVQALLAEALPAHSRTLGEVRTLLATTLIFHSLADRARTTIGTDDDAEFVRGLVHAVVAVLETPMD